MQTFDIVIDIETLSTKKNAAIASVGAVCIDREKRELVGHKLHEIVDVSTIDTARFHISPETFVWWLNQPEEARRTLQSGSKTIFDVLNDLDDYIRDVTGGFPFRVWGNGPQFDMEILENAFDAYGMDHPWHFASTRCLRTVCDVLDVNWKKHRDEATAHNALADAEAESQGLIEVLEAAETAKSMRLLKAMTVNPGMRSVADVHLDTMPDGIAAAAADFASTHVATNAHLEADGKEVGSVIQLPAGGGLFDNLHLIEEFQAANPDAKSATIKSGDTVFGEVTFCADWGEVERKARDFHPTPSGIVDSLKDLANNPMAGEQFTSQTTADRERDALAGKSIDWDAMAAGAVSDEVRTIHDAAETARAAMSELFDAVQAKTKAQGMAAVEELIDGMVNATTQ